MSERASSELAVPPPGETWDALTDPEGSPRLAEEAEVDLRPGGELAVRVDGEQRTGFFEEIDAPRRLVFWWGPADGEASRVEIEPSPATTARGCG